MQLVRDNRRSYARHGLVCLAGGVNLAGMLCVQANLGLCAAVHVAWGLRELDEYLSIFMDYNKLHGLIKLLSLRQASGVSKVKDFKIIKNKLESVIFIKILLASLNFKI